MSSSNSPLTGYIKAIEALARLIDTELEQLPLGASEERLALLSGELVRRWNRKGMVPAICDNCDTICPSVLCKTCERENVELRQCLGCYSSYHPATLRKGGGVCHWCKSL